MNAYLLLQLLQEMTHIGHADKYEELSPDEQFLLYCYQKLDERDRQDILCFLSEKISH